MTNETNNTNDKGITKGVLVELPANHIDDIYYDVKRFVDEDTLANNGKKITIRDECLELIKLGIEVRKNQ